MEDAVITSGYNLPAKQIIHTAGPIWQGGSNNEEQLLHNCYMNSLNLAALNKCKSIAFPLISSGIYGYPKQQAFKIAVSAISDFLMDHELSVYLVVYDRSAITISEKLFSQIEKYIDDNYVDMHSCDESSRSIENHEIKYSLKLYSLDIDQPRKLEDIVLNLDDTFSQMLLRLIDEKGYTDVEVYKKANVDRKFFSKIRSNKVYSPKKSTVLAFAIALDLNLDETLDLLGKAGYTLSHSNKFDVIIEYFIEQGNHDIYVINQALFTFDQMLLGA